MQDEGLRKGIRLIDAIMLVVGMMIGSGIFIVSSDIARTVNSPALLFAVWGIVGVMTIIAALSYGELAAAMPEAGGQYVFLREAYGKVTAFLFGWSFFLVIATGIFAAVAMAFAKYVGVLVPWVASNNILFAIGPIVLTSERLVAMSAIVLLTYVNCRGLGAGVVVQNVFTFLKTFALIALIIAGITIGRNAHVVSANFTDMMAGSSSGMALIMAMGAAMIGAIFSMDAWSFVCFTAAEVKNPQKNLPRALLFGTGLVVVIYLLANVAYMFVLPMLGDPNGVDIMSRGIQYASSDRVATAVAETMLGSSGLYVIALAIVISTFGCVNGTILTSARVFYAMARDGLFFKAVSKIDPVTRVPKRALVYGCIWACILTMTGTFGDLLDYSMFITLIFYALTIAGIFVLRRTRPDMERPYRAWGYPWLQLIYITFALSVVVILLIKRPNFTVPGLLIVLSGLPVYFIWRKLETRP